MMHRCPTWLSQAGILVRLKFSPWPALVACKLLGDSLSAAPKVTYLHEVAIAYPCIVGIRVRLAERGRGGPL